MYKYIYMDTGRRTTSTFLDTSFFIHLQEARDYRLIEFICYTFLSRGLKWIRSFLLLYFLLIIFSFKEFYCCILAYCHLYLHKTDTSICF